MTEEAIEHMRRALASLGLDPKDDTELERTPARFLNMLSEMFEGMGTAPPTLSTFPATSDRAPVSMAGISFRSMCVHHLVPFFGTVDIAYIPDQHLVGFGSLGRVVEYWAARPQIQERLIADISEHIGEALAPRGLLVRVRARQLCTELRGTRKQAIMVSTLGTGELSQGELRQELLRGFQQEERPI